MSECKHCHTKKDTVQIKGKPIEICLHTGCLMDRMLAQYEGCVHNLETIDNNLLRCSNCGMCATPSYE